MSHFAVLVLFSPQENPEAAIERLLAPYSENLEVPEYLEKCGCYGLKASIEAGEEAAQQALTRFLKHGLADYSARRNDPTLEGQSGLSSYLHFGQLSSLRVAVEVRALCGDDQAIAESAEVFLEELIVRKELADNFCLYNAAYDTLDGAADWALKTLGAHKNDPREHLYSGEELTNAQTHDEAWNAAQLQLVRTGKMHGYMRMYWAKKVLEWSDAPEQAIDWLVQANDFYSLDGGDPNGYTGILWSVAGLHDRPWFNRPVHGMVRYMSANGLRTKFSVENYVKKYL